MTCMKDKIELMISATALQEPEVLREVQGD